MFLNLNFIVTAENSFSLEKKYSCVIKPWYQILDHTKLYKHSLMGQISLWNSVHICSDCNEKLILAVVLGFLLGKCMHLKPKQHNSKCMATSCPGNHTIHWFQICLNIWKIVARRFCFVVKLALFYPTPASFLKESLYCVIERKAMKEGKKISIKLSIAEICVRYSVRYFYLKTNLLLSFTPKLALFPLFPIKEIPLAHHWAVQGGKKSHFWLFISLYPTSFL